MHSTHEARSQMDQGAAVISAPHAKLPAYVSTRYSVKNYQWFHAEDESRCHIPADLRESICAGRGHYSVLDWQEEFDNIVVTAGLNRLLVATIKGQGGGGAGGGYADGRRIPPRWLASTAYTAGDVVRQATSSSINRVWICQVSGTSAASEPTWTDVAGASFTDNTVTWIEAAQWYVGLKGLVAGVVLADTMASHAGWTELTPYSNATRVAFIPGAVSAGSVDNSASVAVFNINATATVTGAFVADLQTKAGTLGTLYGAGDFAAARGVASGDTMNVTITASIT